MRICRRAHASGRAKRSNRALSAPPFQKQKEVVTVAHEDGGVGSQQVGIVRGRYGASASVFLSFTQREQRVKRGCESGHSQEAAFGGPPGLVRDEQAAFELRSSSARHGLCPARRVGIGQDDGAEDPRAKQPSNRSRRNRPELLARAHDQVQHFLALRGDAKCRHDSHHRLRFGNPSTRGARRSNPPLTQIVSRPPSASGFTVEDRGG